MPHTFRGAFSPQALPTHRGPAPQGEAGSPPRDVSSLPFSFLPFQAQPQLPEARVEALPGLLFAEAELGRGLAETLPLHIVGHEEPSAPRRDTLQRLLQHEPFVYRKRSRRRDVERREPPLVCPSPDGAADVLAALHVEDARDIRPRMPDARPRTTSSAVSCRRSCASSAPMPN